VIKLLEKRSFLFLIFWILTSSVGCQQNNLPAELNITVNELKQVMVSDTSLIILDVRTPEELTGPLGKIEGVINIPVQNLEERLGELTQYKSNNIAVICRSGNRSVTATRILNQNGYSAKNVLGGMREFNKK
jgi:rhodanese-related sulfurtransferase